MTTEFRDISVGSARLAEGWEEAKDWNQVIVRTSQREQLPGLARKRGLLEFQDVPEGNLERLKTASMNKKRTAVRNRIFRSRDPENLFYLDSKDPVLSTLIKRPA